MRVVASSHYFHSLADDIPPEPLDERVAAVTRERYRRIDRFVQLALVGAGRCALGNGLAPDCGLYLSTGVGPIGSNVLLQESIQRDRKLPMPFHFVNTLGSSACFHVAKDLGLSGEGVLVARAGGSFTAALSCAMADLEAGVASQLLVGAVEECVLPGDRHRALLRRDAGLAVAEGSHWVLVERDDVRGATATAVDAVALDDPAFRGYESRDAACITGYLARHPGQPFGLTWTGRTVGTLVSLA